MQSYLLEFLGTFVFLSAILGSSSNSNPQLAVALGLFTAVTVAGASSHLNPAVSAMQYFAGNLSMNDLLMFVVAQVLGGYVALQVSKM